LRLNSQFLALKQVLWVDVGRVFDQIAVLLVVPEGWGGLLSLVLYYCSAEDNGEGGLGLQEGIPDVHVGAAVVHFDWPAT